jgi:hypothetical protein
MDSLKSFFAKLTEQEELTCAPDICNNVQSNTGMSDSVLGSSDFDIFLEIQYASCVFGLALKS